MPTDQKHLYENLSTLVPDSFDEVLEVGGEAYFNLIPYTEPELQEKAAAFEQRFENNASINGASRRDELETIASAPHPVEERQPDISIDYGMEFD